MGEKLTHAVRRHGQGTEMVSTRVPQVVLEKTRVGRDHGIVPYSLDLVVPARQAGLFGNTDSHCARLHAVPTSKAPNGPA